MSSVERWWPPKTRDMVKVACNRQQRAGRRDSAPDREECVDVVGAGLGV